MKRFILRLVGVLVITFLLSCFVVYDISSISFIAPMEKTSDFLVSDFYQLVADERDEHTLGHQVVVVSVDNLSRQGITETIEAVNYCEPKVIGLDILFNYPQPGDSLLVDAIRNCPRIVLPVFLGQDNSGQYTVPLTSYLYDQLDSISKGAVNLEAESAQSVIRSFRPFFRLEEGVQPNFVTKIVQLSFPEAYNALCERQNVLEEIYYPSYEYEVIPANEVLEKAEVLRDKIVLIGTVSDPQDMHVTTISKATSGVFIHAYALSTILDRNYIRTTPDWLNWMIALLLCAMFVGVDLCCYRYSVCNLFIRILQIILLYLIVWTGCQLFLAYRINVDFTRPLLMVSFGLMAVDMWIGGDSLMAYIRRFSRWMRKRMCAVFKKE